MGEGSARWPRASLFLGDAVEHVGSKNELRPARDARAGVEHGVLKAQRLARPWHDLQLLRGEGRRAALEVAVQVDHEREEAPALLVAHVGLILVQAEVLALLVAINAKRREERIERPGHAASAWVLDEH